MNAKCFGCVFVMLGHRIGERSGRARMERRFGKVSREATFVAYRDGQVLVRLPDGREASAHWSGLVLRPGVCAKRRGCETIGHVRDRC